ncbi:hypothetical protein H4R19_002038 [Coemansia spiralis]|nr:hypothetical protein H4R19_002038 [Coemansia spiralis]
METVAVPALRRLRQTSRAPTHEVIRAWSRSQPNVRAMELHQTLLGHDGCVNALCWSADGRLLFSGSDDSTICVWRAAGDGSMLCRFRTGFGERVFDLKLLPAPNDHLLIACSMDSTTKVYDTRRILEAARSAGVFGAPPPPAADSVLGCGDACLRTFVAHTGAVKRVATIPDAPSELLTCSEDGTVRHFDIREPPQAAHAGPRRRASDGRVVADYRHVGAEVHALDTNPFRPAVFAAGGSLTSIMVHDRRYPVAGAARASERSQRSVNWAGDKCIIRLRRNRPESMGNVFEQLSDEVVTGLRFSRDEPDVVVGSWCYDHAYLFDLGQSSTYTHALDEDDHDDDDNAYMLGKGPTPEPAGKGARRSLKRTRTASMSVPRRPRRNPQAFGRGASLGIRVLTRDDAPHMYSSSSDEGEVSAESADRGEDRPSYSSNCRFCGGDTQAFGSAQLALSGAGHRACNPLSAWTSTERTLLADSLDMFASSVASNSLCHALAASSFALRSIGSQDSRGSGGPPPAMLLQPSASAASVQAAMLAMYTDASLDRWRVESLLHTNQACVHATLFRQRWNQLVDAHPQSPGTPIHSADGLRGIAADAQGLWAPFSSAIRSSDAALELSHISIPAHYNRLLLSWDGARLDMMQFILELLPLVAHPPALHSDEAVGGDGDGDGDGDGEPVQDRLRAEFGDMSHRIREIHEKVRTHWKLVSTRAAAIRGLCQLMSDARNGGADATAAYLAHSNEAFFGVSSRQAVALDRAAAQILARFDQNRSLLEPVLPGDIDAADCASVLNGMARRWWVLCMGPHSDSVEELAMFSGGLFQHWGDTPDDPPGYLWHRWLRYSAGNVPADYDVDELPILPATDTRPSGGEDSESVGAAEQQQQLDSPSTGGWPRRTRELVPDVWSADSTYSSSSEDGRDAGAGRDPNSSPVPVVLPSRRYSGHCSYQTIKDVNFVFGRYVASGSDDGCLFMWDQHTMDIVQIIRGDSEIVNIIEGHPALPIIAVSGIDSEVQIFHLAQGGPSAAHRRSFPVVRAAHTQAAGLRDAAARQACADMAYHPDPYCGELERAGHSPFPPGFDTAAFLQGIQPPFPAVSTSMVARADQIARRNEDMRASGLAHSVLTHQILSNLMFENGAGSSDNTSGSSDNTSGSSGSESRDGSASYHADGEP